MTRPVATLPKDNPRSKPVLFLVKGRRNAPLYFVKGKKHSRLFLSADLAILRRDIKALEEKRRQALDARRNAENHFPAIHNREQQQLFSKMSADYRGIKLHQEKLRKVLAAAVVIDNLRGYFGVQVRNGTNELFWAIPTELIGHVVCIGSAVKLVHVGNGVERTVKITGWRENVSDDDAMPYHAPLAQALLGAKQGDVRSINDATVSWKVATIISAT
jgi:transcription elongation GreA/GreB family factor